MNKIDKLEIRNFKFFDKVKPLKFGSRNILLYGENGSGKSTIYWALYTLLQSSRKEDDKIKKYFTNTTDSSLVNIYSNDDESKIELFLEGLTDRFVISKNDITIKDTSIIEKSLQASDFINYKYLFRFFNFLHKDEIDLFTLFEYEVLHLLQLSEQWQEIIQLKKNKPRVRKNKTEYKDLKDKLKHFNQQLNTKVLNLNEPTKRYLKKFNYHNMKITLSFIDGKYENQTFDRPQINIKLKVIKHDGNDEPILRPQSYFNEAKLTAIALSVRLAITEIKLKNSPLKLLVLDDLLVSLDMSNRDKVLDILLDDEVLKDYQKIILTHDRAFFEMAKHKFDSVQKTKWKYFEMYVDDSGDFEKPFINYESLNYLEKAEGYFNKHDYPVSGNYLRKASEELIKDKLLDTFKANEKDGLDRIIQKYEEMSREFKIPPSKNIQYLKQISKRIFNPSSHDDIVSPLYKKEISDAIKLIKKLKELPQIKILETSIKKESLLRFNFDGKYEIVYIFLADVQLYTYDGNILNRDNILLSKSMHKLLIDEEWNECWKINDKFFSLKKIFKVMEYFLRKKFEYTLDTENFISNLTLDEEALDNNIKKLFERQCESNEQ